VRNEADPEGYALGFAALAPLRRVAASGCSAPWGEAYRAARSAADIRTVKTMKSKHKNPCYYCGAQACSNEHAPPKQMFKGFPCDSITAPSCDEHNSEKSGDDQAIVSAFLIPLHNRLEQYGQDEHSLEANIVKAIDVAKPSFVRAKRKATSRPLLSAPPKVLSDLPDVSYLVPSVDLRAWVRQLTAALVFDGTLAFDPTIIWNEAIAWSPDWIWETERPASGEDAILLFEKKGEIKAQLEQFSWQDGWSAHPRAYPPDIYEFWLCIEPEPQEVIFKHKFYNRYTWYVWFSASQETVLKLSNKVVS